MTEQGGNEASDEIVKRNADAFDLDLLNNPAHPKILQNLQAQPLGFEPSTPEFIEKRSHLMVWGLLLCASVYCWQVLIKQSFETPSLRQSPNILSVRLTQKKLEPPPETNPIRDDLPNSTIETTPTPTPTPKQSTTDTTQALSENPTKDIHNNQSSFSIRQSIDALLEEDNLRQKNKPDNGGIALQRGTLVFDSKLKAQLESAKVAKTNEVKLSGQADEYRDVYGNIVNRSGGLCATTYDLPQIGAFTYYSGCPKPVSKIRRFGRESIKRNQ